jgi:hypothetical protein
MERRRAVRERRLRVRATSRRLREPRGEWPHEAAPLPAPRCVNLAPRSVIPPSRRATRAEAETGSDADTEADSGADSGGDTGRGAEARSQADPAGREVNSDQVGRQDGGTSSGARQGPGPRKCFQLLAVGTEGPVARRPDVLPSHLIRVDP